MKVGIIVEAGDVREVHHVALLIGYGASAINPYLAMETCEELVRSGLITGVTPEKAVKNVIKALGKGVLKIMSKMGISTVSSYAGAQAFEAVGLSQEFVDQYFTGTTSKLGGVGIDVIAAENLARHDSAYPLGRRDVAHERLATGGEYQWRRDGAAAPLQPGDRLPAAALHAHPAVRRLPRVHEARRRPGRDADDAARHVQAADRRCARRCRSTRSSRSRAIVKRFSTGAMSYGSISKEAHETLAIAMNRLGAKSNTGEGGEDLDRLLDPERRSAIKQVASGRFGVTSMYLTHADDIQIKLAQGAKPGEGGQLPPDQGLPVGRAHASRDRGRRSDLAAPAPRHLLDRRPQAAHLRPQARQPERARPRQARQRVGHRRGRRGRREGTRRCRARLRPRRRHRRVARSTR